VRFELLLLAELGFGLHLERCAVSGAEEDLEGECGDYEISRRAANQIAINQRETSPQLKPLRN